jgi:hypothetical protein
VQFGSLWRSQRQEWGALVLPLLFFVVCLAFGVTELHFDVLERAYLLEHPSECMKSRSGSPQSLFLFYAHILELPLAWLLGLRWLGLDGVRALVLFESLCGAVALWLVYRLVRMWGGKPSAAILAQVILATSLSFWRMASGGEEKIAALASQLAFLAAFWHTLQTGRAGWAVAVTLATAPLVHLTGLVMVPFAALVLWLAAKPWRAYVPRVARNVVIGTVAAGMAIAGVMAYTNDVHTPAGFIEHATFYHRASGTDFFELGGPGMTPGTRLGRMRGGIASFFGVSPWGSAAALALVALIATGALLSRSRARAGARAAAVKKRGGATPERSPTPQSDSVSHVHLRRLAIHAAILCALWTAHFLFYQPQAYESWTLPIAILVVVAAVLWSAILPAALLIVPLLTLPGNWSYMLRLHRDDPLHRFRAAVEAVTRPGDVVLLYGGRVNGQITQGSLAMRYFLVMLQDRRIASLHDILHVGEGEYWRPNFTSAADLQRAIDSGAQVVTAQTLVEVFEQIAATGAIEIDLRPVAPGLLQVAAFRPRREFTFTPEHLHDPGTSPAPVSASPPYGR